MRNYRRQAGYLLLAVTLLAVFFIRVDHENDGGDQPGEGTAAEEQGWEAEDQNEEDGVPEEGAETIRVLLTATDFSDRSHKKLVLSGTGAWYIETPSKKKSFKKGEVQTLTAKSPLLKEGRIRVCAKDQADGRILVENIKRSSGTPAYPGTLWISKKKGKLLLINEVDLETYLCGVVNSEMPASYGMEALKAQAVCARTYAIRQKQLSSLSDYGADLDDSTQFQVYMNQLPEKNTTKAVEETRGQVLEAGGALCDIFYFSTSCGATASADEIWSGMESRPYLQGKLQEKEDHTEAEAADGEAAFSPEGLKEETVFSRFLSEKAEDKNMWEWKAPWYRWEVFISRKHFEEMLENALAAYGERYPEQVRIRLKSGKYLPLPVDSIGKLKEVRVEERSTGGVVTALAFVGSRRTLLVTSEYVIRLFCGPALDVLARSDGSEVPGLSLLPSAFFTVEKKDGGFWIRGGGYGHGVGLSQNGACAMAEEGKDYQEILSSYFSGCRISGI